MEACGDVDELNSAIGGLISAMPPGQDEVVAELKGIQSALLIAGAILGTAPSSKHSEALEEITPGEVNALEAATDRIHSGLPKLTGFVLPGGHEASCRAHAARTVCRRAERRAVAVVNAAEDGPDRHLDMVVVYLNRLSDYLFCLARHNNLVTGTAEEIWKK
jgi:cob(I)alamin adenosyltransferase